MKLIIMGIFMTVFNINSYANEAFEIEVYKEYGFRWGACSEQYGTSISDAKLKANDKCAPTQAVLIEEILHQCDYVSPIVKDHYIGLFQCEEISNMENI